MTASDVQYLRPGQSTTFASHDCLFTLSRLTHQTYNLRHHGTYHRSRFGDRHQITEDLEHVLMHGKLPQPVGPRW